MNFRTDTAFLSRRLENIFLEILVANWFLCPVIHNFCKILICQALCVYFYGPLRGYFVGCGLANILLITSVTDNKEMFLNSWYSYFLSNIYWKGFNSVTYFAADYYFLGPFDINIKFLVHLTFWRRTFLFQILAHPVFNMWVIQKPNKVVL